MLPGTPVVDRGPGMSGGGRLMFRLRAALSAVFVAAGLALAVSIFVVSVVAPSARSEEKSPSEAQYTQYNGGEGGQKEDPTGYDNFYHRWTDALAKAPQEGAASQGS